MYSVADLTPLPAQPHQAPSLIGVDGSDPQPGLKAELRRHPCSTARVVAICVSAGGIPKRPLAVGQVTLDGLIGDGRHHTKHIRRDRAISLFDLELLTDLVREGYPLGPGAAGENLTVEGLHVQQLLPGTRLQIGNVVLELQQPRKPCYVLDAIDPGLKDAIVGRCGYMASVVQEGEIRPGMAIKVLRASPLSFASTAEKGT
jgi:MOSC domain-containing protein YiiM